MIFGLEQAGRCRAGRKRSWLSGLLLWKRDRARQVAVWAVWGGKMGKRKGRGAGPGEDLAHGRYIE
jgi:hypothetical protein